MLVKAQARELEAVKVSIRREHCRLVNPTLLLEEEEERSVLIDLLHAP